MTLVRNRRLFLVALVTLVTVVVDGSYLISSATRPPRLKHHQQEHGETGSPLSPADDRNVYRQSAPSASSSKAAMATHKVAIIGQTYPSLDSHRGRSSAPRSPFWNALQPAARAFLLHGGHRDVEGLRSKRDRNQFERGYPDIDDFTHGLSDVEDNIIDESPKSSKNLNYYPYRGKRPFEVPQIGKCHNSYVGFIEEWKRSESRYHFAREFGSLVVWLIKRWKWQGITCG